MTIRELRTTCGMSIAAFSKYFEIPYRTVQDWDSNRRTPPDYVVKLIEYKLRNEELI
ncbi:transcriptional regulator [Ruminococcus sp.]|uniref:helix-turn-helix domain-containing protein n=1 Tax=Ruminococcus sp. TaxID=41978 RepID=UPI001B642011|nr:transcriptional regulator [Ruminococcus sp.]MBP5433640.1 transcriptional regulator [Ruminococcus sp.]